MMTLALVAVLIAAPGTRDPSTLPVLCVRADSPEQPSTAVAQRERDILSALRARISARKVNFTACDRDADSEDWRLVVRGDPDAAGIVIELRGGALDLRSNIATTDMRRHELAQVVALRVLDALYAYLQEGVDLRTPAGDAAVVAVVPEQPIEAPPDEESMSTEMGAPALDGPGASVPLDLTVAVVWAPTTEETTAVAELAASFFFGSFGLGAFVGISPVAPVERREVKVGGLDLTAGVAGSWRSDWGEATVRIEGQHNSVHIDGESELVQTSSVSHLHVGASAGVATFPWRWAGLQIGPALRGVIWTRPLKLTLDGRGLHRHPEVQLHLGFVTRLGL